MLKLAATWLLMTGTTTALAVTNLNCPLPSDIVVKNNYWQAENLISTKPTAAYTTTVVAKFDAAFLPGALKCPSPESPSYVSNNIICSYTLVNGQVMQLQSFQSAYYYISTLGTNWQITTSNNNDVNAICMIPDRTSCTYAKASSVNQACVSGVKD